MKRGQARQNWSLALPGLISLHLQISKRKEGLAGFPKRPVVFM